MDRQETYQQSHLSADGFLPPPFIGITGMRFFISQLGLMLSSFFCIHVVVRIFFLAGAIFFVYLMLPFFGFPRAFQFLEHPLSADVLLFPVSDLQVKCSST